MKRAFLSLAGATISWVLCLCCIGVFGCKPKERPLSGQVFIVTRSGENVKLGAVEVCLIDRQQAAEFLKKGGKFDLLNEEFENAKRAFAGALRDREVFATNGPLTQPEYLKTKSDKADLEKECADARAEIQVFLEEDKKLKAKTEEAVQEYNKWRRARSTADLPEMLSEEAVIFDKLREANTKVTNALVEYKAYLTNEQEKVNAISARLLSKGKALVETDRKLRKIQEVAGIEQTNLDTKLETARVRLETANAGLEDCVWKFQPTSVAGVATDADGRFVMNCPLRHELAICAKAERNAGAQKEKFFWLIELPKGEEPAQILLANHNFTFASP